MSLLYFEWDYENIILSLFVNHNLYAFALVCLKGHYNNTHKDFAYNDFTYNINKCNIIYMFLYTVRSKVISVLI